MCGLCGLIEPRSPERSSRLRRLTEAVRHRGPDDTGAYEDDAAALGHARLAVIDRAGGAQPMASDDGRFRIVLNGEIYNYRELRRELGGAWRTESDTEALLRAWMRWGPDALARLDGMFAFAVWDARERALFAARDRLGKKPFAWRLDRGRFAFASELRALDEGGLDPEALDLYLAYGYVPSPRSALPGVRKLPPGHWLRFAHGRVETGRYWSPAPEEGDVRERLERAVAKRLVGEVPVGAFLSGGIDSSIVVGLMRRHGPVRTFTVGFEELGFDERAAAREAAEHFGTEHREYVVGPRDVESLGTILRGYGEPFGDPSAVPTWVLSREARRHVTVALSGDGGDEGFGGYRRYLAMRLLGTLRPAAPAVRALAGLYPGERGRRALREVGGAPWEAYAGLVRVFPDLRPLRGAEGDVGALLRDAWPAGVTAEEAAARADLVTYLPGDLLVKTDIASMAHALEVRCPFLDPAVVSAALAVPPARKIRGMRTKAYLRERFADLLPPRVRSGPKRGFGLPVDAWLGGPLRGMVEDLLLDATARGRGLFDAGEVGRLVRGLTGGRGAGRRVWALLAFETWMRERPPAVISP